MCKKLNEKIKAALIEAGGIISEAARVLGMTRGKLAMKIHRNKELQKAVEDARESMLDFAESQLMKKIRQGDSGAIFFFLKCQGKSRGYIERQELNITNQEIKILLPDDMKDDG